MIKPRPQDYIKLEPNEDEKFYPSVVKDIVSDVLDNNLGYFEFDELKAQEKCEEITKEIRERVQNLKLPRFKIVVQVVLGLLEGQGLRIASKCLWDPNNDNYCSYTYKKDNFYCTAMVFGCYNE